MKGWRRWTRYEIMRVIHKYKWSSKARHRGELVEINIERAEDSLFRVMNTIIGW
jgi:hypothetical protein